MYQAKLLYEMPNKLTYAHIHAHTDTYKHDAQTSTHPHTHMHTHACMHTHNQKVTYERIGTAFGSSVSVLLYAAVCCSVLQCVAKCIRKIPSDRICTPFESGMSVL